MADGKAPPPVAQILRMPSTASETLARPERLVGLGFRCWLGGYQSGNIENWEICWTYYRQELGTRGARSAMTDLSAWVNAVRCHSLRDIALFPAHCPAFCRDECLAVSLIAASQHRACPALNACAYALIGADAIGPVLRTADSFAITLETLGIHLGGDLVVDDAMARQGGPVGAVH